MKHYYLIYTTDNDREGSYKYIAETLEEAKSKIMDYANWYCGKGTCLIFEVNNNFKKLRSYKYWNGILCEIDGNRLNLGRHK